MIDVDEDSRADANIFILIVWFVLVSIGAFVWLVGSGELNLS